MDLPALAPMVFLCGAAFCAGLIDAVVGGGGLIQIPALFAALPDASAATLVGTNKVSSVWGTSFAAWRYSRTIRIEWGAALPGALAAFVFAFLGAWAVTRTPPDLLRRALPFVLIAVAVYTYRKKDFGSVHAPIERNVSSYLLALAVGAAIGFYDGFFGPGTGSFLIFLYVRYFGFDFLSASASAKLVNVACNLAALLWFGFSGHLLLAVGFLMMPFNVAGSLAGSRLALRHGSIFVRRLFLVVVTLLIARTGYDAFLR
jgi:uncharacterized membrane protein YfcA